MSMGIGSCLETDSCSDSSFCGQNDCFNRGFPECLETGLLALFGKNGKKALDSIVLNETFQSADLASPEDLAKFYEEYMDRLQNILGNKVAKVIAFNCFKLGKNSQCEDCPIARNRNHSQRAFRPRTDSVF